MKTKREQIENIHLSFINGQYKQACRQMINYKDNYNLFEDYAVYLSNIYENDSAPFYWLQTAINVFMRSVYE